MLVKWLKSIVWPAFEVSSTQMLVKINNSCSFCTYILIVTKLFFPEADSRNQGLVWSSSPREQRNFSPHSPPKILQCHQFSFGRRKSKILWRSERKVPQQNEQWRKWGTIRTIRPRKSGKIFTTFTTTTTAATKSILSVPCDSNFDGKKRARTEHFIAGAQLSRNWIWRKQQFD